ncbi:MAG: MucR family transcriptional regulator [Romboutsia sp.]|nr:MucR family transcriptional regulator [Romboutsia sp.]
MKYICEICGRSFKKLSEHLKYKHHIDNNTYKERFGLNRTTKLTGNNFIPNITNDITKYSIDTRFEKGHKESAKKRRLQTVKNRIGSKYNVKK